MNKIEFIYLFVGVFFGYFGYLLLKIVRIRESLTLGLSSIISLFVLFILISVLYYLSIYYFFDDEFVLFMITMLYLSILYYLLKR